MVETESQRITENITENRAVKYTEELKLKLWGEAPFPDGMVPVAACKARKDPRRGIILNKGDLHFCGFKGELTPLSEPSYRRALDQLDTKKRGEESTVERQIRCTPEEKAMLLEHLRLIRSRD